MQFSRGRSRVSAILAELHCLSIFSVTIALPFDYSAADRDATINLKTCKRWPISVGHEKVFPCMLEFVLSFRKKLKNKIQKNKNNIKKCRKKSIFKFEIGF